MMFYSYVCRFAEAIGQIHTNHVIREACEEIEP